MTGDRAANFERVAFTMEQRAQSGTSITTASRIPTTATSIGIRTFLTECEMLTGTLSGMAMNALNRRWPAIRIDTRHRKNIHMWISPEGHF
jgi:hypothetical protein